MALDTLPGATYSVSNGINNSGTVVGWSYINGFATATIWNGTTANALTMLPDAVASYAFDINSRRQVAGITRFLDGTQQATVWVNGIAIALGILPMRLESTTRAFSVGHGSSPLSASAN